LLFGSRHALGWQPQSPFDTEEHDVTVLDRFRLDGRVAVVTGASSGLGVAFATALAQAGADVVLGARRADRLQETAALVEAAGARAVTLPTDVTRTEDCDALIAAAIDTFGRVDVLVNNAGVASAVPATRETPDQFRGIVDVNLFGAYWMAQAAGRAMTSGGSIINVSSILAVTTAGLPQAAYAASKAALLGLSRDLAAQWGSRKGIRVNALLPGFFLSEMTDEYPEGYLDAQMARLAIRRPGDPEELAATVVWLASEAGGYVTGQSIIVDGGLTIA
jgi:NAD(P)-dependent dehydrogenase (short-subunit alcohol dehydrogenase family)